MAGQDRHAGSIAAREHCVSICGTSNRSRVTSGWTSCALLAKQKPMLVESYSTVPNTLVRGEGAGGDHPRPVRPDKPKGRSILRRSIRFSPIPAMPV